jgi:hypothetical protein
MSHSLYFNVLTCQLVYQTQRFGTYLLVRDVDSKFSFNPSKSMTDVKVDVALDEWL